MSIKPIKEFSDLARSDGAVGEKLKAVEKVRDMLSLARDNGFEIIEDSLYPPNEPQFTEDQLSLKMVKALLRA